MLAGTVAIVYVLIENLFEVCDDGVAAEGCHQSAIDVDRGFRLLKSSGQGDADVGVLGFSGAIDDAAHDREFQLFYAGIAFAPCGHTVAEVELDLLRELLEKGTGGTSASGAGGDLRSEAANGE